MQHYHFLLPLVWRILDLNEFEETCVLRFQQRISNTLLMKFLRRTKLQFWNYAIEQMWASYLGMCGRGSHGLMQKLSSKWLMQNCMSYLVIEQQWMMKRLLK